MALNKVGGILILISLFLPTIIIIRWSEVLIIWMFGLINRVPRIFSWWISPATIGIVSFITLLVCSLKCIKKYPGETRLYGILSLVFIVIYYFVSLILYVEASERLSMGEFLFLPFIGFFGIIIGAILNILAKE